MQWIYQAEQLFKIYKILEEQKVPIVGMYFEPDVLLWYQMTHRNTPAIPWPLFAHALELEFIPSPSDCPRNTLFKLFQQV